MASASDILGNDIENQQQKIRLINYYILIDSTRCSMFPVVVSTAESQKCNEAIFLIEDCGVKLASSKYQEVKEWSYDQMLGWKVNLVCKEIILFVDSNNSSEVRNVHLTFTSDKICKIAQEMLAGWIIHFLIDRKRLPESQFEDTLFKLVT
ncbi:hypothetical protein GJ496_002875 [Pomphorhynchus laevis]|nr:hypothetical protein GJ496_002875 [Pomphorhynchus laevis]